MPVSVKNNVRKNTPAEKRTLGNISLKNTKLGAGQEFVLLVRWSKARVKGIVLFTDTGIRTYPGWASITKGGGFRSKPRRCRTDRNQHAYANTCRVQAAGPAWASGPEDRSKIETGVTSHVEIESIELRPTLVVFTVTDEDLSLPLDIRRSSLSNRLAARKLTQVFSYSSPALIPDAL